MSPNLGALPLSPDLLLKSKLGMWAFELDEDKAPRMYVDDAMLSLIGLTEQTSPEATYHAWYDHVDPAYYSLVEEAVTQMSSGHHAEVQYPWHHPDGRTFVVRCGGVRNPAYTAGVRIEGCHQNITEIQSFTMEVKKQRQRLESDYQTIQGLSNEFDILHLLNLETDEFTPFYVENDKMIDPEFLVASFEGFYSAMRASVKGMIHPDHLEKMLKYADKDYIKSILRHKSRQVEEERRAKESEEERYNFLINVAHEIRTPLTLILGPLGRFLTTEQLTEKGHRTITRVRQQANRMNILLDTVLTSNKMEEGAEKVRPEPVNLNDWLQRNTEDFTDEAINREMNLDLLLKPMIGDVDVDKLFERYYRATEDKTGFGIGLFYSQSIIKAHNGRIGAYNNIDGRGATFWFELPVS